MTTMIVFMINWVVLPNELTLTTPIFLAHLLIVPFGKVAGSPVAACDGSANESGRIDQRRCGVGQGGGFPIAWGPQRHPVYW